MTTGTKITLLAATTAIAAVVAAFGWAHAWRYWPAPFAAPIVLAVALAAIRSSHGTAAAAELEPQAPPPQHFREVLDRDTAVANIPVPSASANYDFLLSATIHFRPSPMTSGGPNSASPGTLARTAIIDRASQQTVIENPVDCVQAQHRLAAVLAVVQSDASDSLKVWATDVSLSMRPDDLDRLRRLDELAKQREVWEHKRAIEREVSTYFSEEVLKDPGTAVAWWMAKHHDRTQEEIENAVDLIGPLAQLAAAANNDDLPEAFRRFVDPPSAFTRDQGPDADHQASPRVYEPFEDDEGWETDAAGKPPFEARIEDHVSGLLEQLDFTPGTTERARFTRQLATHIEQAGKNEAAARIREAFGVMDFTASAPPAPNGGSGQGPAEEASWS